MGDDLVGLAFGGGGAMIVYTLTSREEYLCFIAQCILLNAR